MSTVYSQAWAAGTFAKPGFYQSTSFNGADAPITNYPEIASGEGVKTVDSAGPSGERVVDLDSSSGRNYGSAGIALLGIGDESGLWETSNSTTVTWSEKLSTTAISQGGFNQLICLVNNKNGTGGTDRGLFAQQVFLSVTLIRDTGNNFNYELFYDDFGSNVYLNSATDVADDAWHNFKLEFQPGTVTGSFASVASDGWIKFYVDDVLIYDISAVQLTVNFESTPWTNPTKAYGVWFGYAGLPGPVTNLNITVPSTAPVPPMQRASYVFFSSQITEKQTETRLSKTFLQLLYTDPPPAAGTGTLGLTEVTGTIVDQVGNPITYGTLRIKPDDFITVDDTYLIAPAIYEYSVTGTLSIMLAPSNTVHYTVEFDPDPNDTVTPINLKVGYFKDRWLIPSVGPVDIVDL